MSWNLTSPVTGAAQTGLTSPTYTLVSDSAPTPNGKQHAVSAVGGTQPGVNVSGASTPFTITFFKPQVLKTRKLNGNGMAVSTPMNVYKTVTRKSASVDATGGTATVLITTIIEVPAGAELVDSANVRAGLSLHFGALSQQSAGVGDTAVSGTF